MNTAVAKTKGVEVSTELMDDIFSDAGAGSSFAADEMTMPFIRLAQQMSPHVNKTNLSTSRVLVQETSSTT